jgi:hypothetical protein
VSAINGVASFRIAEPVIEAQQFFLIRKPIAHREFGGDCFGTPHGSDLSTALAAFDEAFDVAVA